jgi:hypothetical protein
MPFWAMPATWDSLESSFLLESSWAMVSGRRETVCMTYRLGACEPLDEVHRVGVHDVFDLLRVVVLDVGPAAVSSLLEAVDIQLEILFAPSDVLDVNLVGVKLATEVAGHPDLVLGVTALVRVEVVV